ncbi:hypothetical protein B0A52_01991 [Exophiala mesophila]|uniref:Uncharacterized protein n=1 Tax=Exophiala mesophila TaxID=212818 RepID=A0A438NEK2_EXOME|nr:hypothetical protein B0A52_01991 [Exophiala mesophila]
MRSASPSAYSNSSYEPTIDERTDSPEEPDAPDNHERRYGSANGQHASTKVEQDDFSSTNIDSCDKAAMGSARPLTAKSNVCDHLISGRRDFHHLSYFNTYVMQKTATPPAVSLALIKTNAGKPGMDEDIHLIRLAMARNAMGYIDPVIYNGPKEHLYTLWGTKLQEAVTGYCRKLYRPVGSWMHDSYKPDEDVPVIARELYSSTEVVLNSVVKRHNFLVCATHEWQNRDDYKAFLRPRKRKLERDENWQLKYPLPKSRLSECWNAAEDDLPIEQEQPGDDWRDRVAALDGRNKPLNDWAGEVKNEVLDEYPAQQERQSDWKAKLAVLDEWKGSLENWADEVADGDDVEPRSQPRPSRLNGQDDRRLEPWLTGPWRKVNK